MERLGYGDCFRVCEKREADLLHSGLITLAHMAPRPLLLRDMKPNKLRNFMLPFFKINGTLDVNSAYLNSWMYVLTGKIQPSVLAEFKTYFPKASSNGRAFLAHASLKNASKSIKKNSV